MTVDDIESGTRFRYKQHEYIRMKPTGHCIRCHNAETGAQGYFNGTEEVQIINQMTNYSLIRKLIGPVEPAGCTETDRQRLENLKQLTDLTQRLLYDIMDVSRNRSRQEHSMKVAGTHAQTFLDEWKEILNDE